MSRIRDQDEPDSYEDEKQKPGASDLITRFLQRLNNYNAERWEINLQIDAQLNCCSGKHFRSGIQQIVGAAWQASSPWLV